jgi:molybdate transport system substrate-binding protein
VTGRTGPGGRRRRRPRRATVAVLLGLGLVLAACGGNDGPKSADPSSSSATGSRTATVTGTLTVLAASSLTDAFGALGRAFEDGHPGLDVRFDFGASSALVRQLGEGASADVLASADEVIMGQAVDDGHVAGPVVFARNRLALLVERGNPKGIRGLADVARPGVVLVLCAPEVPCGRYAAAALTKAGDRATPASLEENVKGVVAKVTLGEADAGIVYATDVKAAGGAVEGVAIDGADDPDLTARYPIAVVRAAPNPAAATAWVEFVRSAEGQRVLASFGFLAP